MTGDRSDPRRIVLCVDDVGLHHGIDAAVFALHDRGRVSAASALVDGPSWAAVAPALRERAGTTLEAGLHLNLSQRLRPDAYALALPLLIAAAGARALSRTRLRAAIERQFDRFESTLQREPDFVDGHQHVQQLPQVRDVVFEVLARRRAQPRPWLRVGLPPTRNARARPGERDRAEARLGDRLKARLIAALGARTFATRAHREGYRTCHALLGVRALDADAGGLEADLQAWLAAAEDGDVLMTHPAADAATADPLAAARVAEFALLAGKRFGEWIEGERIAIVTMAAIGRSTTSAENPPP